jgi:nicotinic acid mononucleotide adenylyltransferase
MGRKKRAEKINRALIGGLFNPVHNHAHTVMTAYLLMLLLVVPLLKAERTIRRELRDNFTSLLLHRMREI